MNASEKRENLLVNPELFPSEEERVIGTVGWPETWRVFGPVDRDDRIPSSEILRTYPETLTIEDMTLKGKDVNPINNIYDFPGILKEGKTGDTAYVFLKLLSAEEQTITMGMGADWWMQAWVNGKLFFDTTETSNLTWPFSICNHLTEVELSKGNNVLAVRFIRGGGSTLALGGPDQLRKILEEDSEKRIIPEGWNLFGQAYARYDWSEKAIVLHIERHFPDRLYQLKNLEPGHYLLRALAKTDNHQACLAVEGAPGRMPIGVSDDYKWAELPFYVAGEPGNGKTRIVTSIFQYSRNIFPVRGQTKIKRIELLRLGDTALPANWASTIPVDKIHKLEEINRSPQWTRPGKVIFKDSFIGTELWMMTQDGRIQLSYAGHPHFSHDGKYVKVHSRTPQPGWAMRTDGSSRYKFTIGTELWLYPWEIKRLPEDSDPSEWVRKSRSTTEIEMFNIKTEETHAVKMPVREGWQIISVPSITVGVSGLVKIKDIDHETIVWYSEENREIALSDPEGKNFRVFPVKSSSAKPEKDSGLFVRRMNFDGKPSNIVFIDQHWQNPVDEDGKHYFLYELNRENSLEDTDNPYQLWAVPLCERDERGPLQAVLPEPERVAPENVNGRFAGQWSLFMGTSRNVKLRAVATYITLEDGTDIFYSVVGEHSDFGGTVRAQSMEENKVRFIGNYPGMDHIDWPHAFRHDEHYAVVWSAGNSFPPASIAMIDLKHDTLWTVAIKNFYDHVERGLRSREIERERQLHGGGGRVEAGVIYAAPVPSPDFTKIIYPSPMLAMKNASGKVADAYIAVVRYPMPPVNVSMKDNFLIWEKPIYHSEIMGFNVYRAEESGTGNYMKLNKNPVEGTRYELLSQNEGFYVVTSVEHSGLESRNFSNEVSLGNNKTFRHFYQPADGNIEKPMVPFFEPKNASNSYAVAITDPEMLYREALAKGLEGSVGIEADIPLAGYWRILCRVRGMSGIERSSYTTGWPADGHHGTGDFKVKTGSSVAGNIQVEGQEWKWVELDTGPFLIDRGKVKIEFSTSNAGIAIDNILLTNDPGFIPEKPDNNPFLEPSAPGNLRVAGIKTGNEDITLEWLGYSVESPYVKIEWLPSEAPQGVRYYSIHRSEEDEFLAKQQNLIGSSKEPFFIDTGLEQGHTYTYRVIAVDSWGNASIASEALSVEIK